jgi:hypothetical protein
MPALLLFLAALLGIVVGLVMLLTAASDRYSLPVYHPASLAAPYLARAGCGLVVLSAAAAVAAWVLA